MYVRIITLLVGTFLSTCGAATSGHDAHQELLDGIYALEAYPHGISYTDFMTAKQHDPEVTAKITKHMRTTKGTSAMQLQSSSLSIGKNVVISCFVAGLNLDSQLRQIKPDCVNLAHDIVESIRFHWNVYIMAKDVKDPLQHLPTGKQFRSALFNVHYNSFKNIAAFYVVASRRGATAYFMKQQPRIDQEQICIAKKEMEWLGKIRAASMAKKRQRWILKHPDMKIQTMFDPVSPVDPSTFDYIFDIDGAAIAEHFAPQASDAQRGPKRQRLA
jgi:hypothetical protein